MVLSNFLRGSRGDYAAYDDEYYSRYRFVCNCSNYEKDEENGRCYVLVESCNLHDPEMDGALVKRRISRKEYEDRRLECLQNIKKYREFCERCGLSREEIDRWHGSLEVLNHELADFGEGTETCCENAAETEQDAVNSQQNPESEAIEIPLEVKEFFSIIIETILSAVHKLEDEEHILFSELCERLMSETDCLARPPPIINHLEKFQLQGYHFEKLIHSLKLENTTLSEEIHFA